MTANDDFIAQLEDYFERFDGATPLPDRVRDAIRAELPSARQVQPGTGLLRFFAMLSNASTGARLGLAATAVVVAVVLGAAFINNRSGPAVGGTVTPPPAATIAPSVTPSSRPTPAASSPASPPMLGAATYVACDPADTGKSCLSAGTYQLTGGPTVWPVRLTVDVPAGWFEWLADQGADAVLVQGGADTKYSGTGWGVMFSTVGDVYRDPCDLAKGVIPAAQVATPQKLAAVMATWPRFAATAAEPITVGGDTGLKLKLTSTGPDSCYSDGSVWQTASGGSLDTYPMIGGSSARAAGTFEIVDTGHGLVVIRTTDFPETSPAEVAGGMAADATRHAADLPALHAILESIRFTDVSG